jgi:hypothetical protein
MDGTNGLKATTPVTVSVASNKLNVNVFPAPGIRKNQIQRMSTVSKGVVNEWRASRTEEL